MSDNEPSTATRNGTSCGHRADPLTWLEGGPGWQCRQCFPDVFPRSADLDDMSADDMRREIEQLRRLVATYYVGDAAVMAAARWRREAERLSPLARIGTALNACERIGGVVYWPAGGERVFAAYDLYDRLSALDINARPPRTERAERPAFVAPTMPSATPARRALQEVAMAG
ncbi:MAG TPA: hypothetical protein VGM78_04980 [Ilumatobacteraceae bacterium]